LFFYAQRFGASSARLTVHTTFRAAASLEGAGRRRDAAQARCGAPVEGGARSIGV
jgi:hypothetical protein